MQLKCLSRRTGAGWSVRDALPSSGDGYSDQSGHGECGCIADRLLFLGQRHLEELLHRESQRVTGGSAGAGMGWSG